MRLCSLASFCLRIALLYISQTFPLSTIEHITVYTPVKVGAKLVVSGSLYQQNLTRLSLNHASSGLLGLAYDQNHGASDCLC
jgi:hypothetical protein